MEKEPLNQKRMHDPKRITLKGTDFSDRLKQAIGEKSIRAFAKETGISYGAMHKYFANLTTPTLENLVTLAKHAGVSIEWLATGEMPTAGPISSGKEKAKKENNGAPAITDLLDALTKDECYELTQILKREGVGILLLLLDKKTIDILRLIKSNNYTDLLSDNLHEDQAKQLIELLPIRSSLKDVIKIGLKTTEEADKEVCAIMMRHQEASQPGSDIVTNKKSGTM